MKPHIHIDFSSHVPKLESKPSRLHRIKEYPDPKGNRAERRAYAKLKRSKDVK